MLKTLKELLLGKSQDPLSPDSRHHIALIGFLAWIGLGADGLSSSCYGPALGFLALGRYHHLAIYLALLTAVTVFIIAISYNQVIRLFPNGGGGYKVANELLGPTAGIISGAALLIDYLLTIAISCASAVEAIYSMLPLTYQHHKLLIEILLVVILTLLNMRGMKESIKFLLPIFIGFFFTHVAIIIYGIAVHGSQLPIMIHQTAIETHQAFQKFGMIATIGILLRAYSLGSGTYTGLEAVSNNVNMLAEPRVKTGKWTMMYMATSLSFVAGGILLLYMLWHIHPHAGMTLNAAVFSKILAHTPFHHASLLILMLFEAGLLFVGANTGFLGGPAVLANMSIDSWVPHRFGALSSRLVKQNGVLFFGLLTIIILFFTEGHIELLVIFYSINVFITFSVSLLGLMVYFWQHRQHEKHWIRSLLLSTLGFTICAFILVVTIVSKIGGGSWAALLLTSLFITAGYLLKRHYKHYQQLKRQLDKSLSISTPKRSKQPPIINPDQPTAVFLVNRLGAAMHTILWVERMFPHHFKNYIFISYGIVDNSSFSSDSAIERLQKQRDRTLDYLTSFANEHGIAAFSKCRFGTDPIEGMEALSKEINQDFPNAIYFAARYTYANENILTRWLHSDFSLLVQRRLQNMGVKMLIIPLNLSP